MMTVFSEDVDILRYEPVLFGDLHFPWQVLCAGTDGALAGTDLTSASADFVSAGVGAGGVVYLQSGDGGLDGAYEIVSVDSATKLTVSVLRADGASVAVGVGSYSAVTYRVGTFGPQVREVLFELTQYFGIGPGNPNSVFDASDIVDTSVLRQASVYGVIAGIYATLSSRAEGGESFGDKSLYYRRLFEKARERSRLSVDIDGDGIGEKTKIGGSIKLVRD